MQETISLVRLGALERDDRLRAIIQDMSWPALNQRGIEAQPNFLEPQTVQQRSVSHVPEGPKYD